MELEGKLDEKQLNSWNFFDRIKLSLLLSKLDLKLILIEYQGIGSSEISYYIITY